MVFQKKEKKHNTQTEAQDMYVGRIMHTDLITVSPSTSLEDANILVKKKQIDHLLVVNDTGKLVGIIGGSGVGKSTLLNVLNGNLKPQKGKVLINGYNLNYEKEKSELQGVIGYVPQEDLLIEDLTVYQNLFFNAKLCLNQFGKDEIEETVNKILEDLDLQDIKDLKVGNPLKKVISGGQRKRLNIGLELIREPSILFVDEPTSGLSSKVV